MSDVSFETPDSGPATRQRTTMAGARDLKDRLDGQLLLPGDAGYDDARTVWNAMADRRPRMIVRCNNVGDVVAAVRCAAPALRGWRDQAAEAPRQATFTASILGDGPPAVGFVWVGQPEQGRRLLPALRALGRPVAERVVPLSYLELQQIDDTVEGHAQRRYWKGHYVRELTDEAIEAVLRRGTSDGRGEHLPNVTLQAYGGAIAEVADCDTAFSHRDASFEFVAAAGWTDPAEDESRMAAARRCAAELDRFASGAYVNALNDEGQQGVRRAYSSEKLARLVAVKDIYDPDNVFHLNHNIRPSRHATPSA